MLERFTEPPYRHPLDANAMLVRATQGCTWNRCEFCYVSKEFPFLSVTEEEMEQQMKALEGRFPADTRIWLVGSNPLVLPTEKLLAYADIIRRHYPHFSEISMQSRISDVKHKSLDDLKALLDAGYREIFVGVESASNKVLRMLNKGQTAEEALEQMKRLNSVGISVVPMLIFGAGGKGRGKEDGRLLAELLSQVKCRMISTTGLTLFKGAPLREMAACGEFIEAPETEKIEEMISFIKNYTGSTFLYCYHYLNPVHFTANLPEDKEKILRGLRNFLKENTPEEIEAMVFRKGKMSL